jgi:hypothetical protein
MTRNQNLKAALLCFALCLLFLAVALGGCGEVERPYTFGCATDGGAAPAWPDAGARDLGEEGKFYACFPEGNPPEVTVNPCQIPASHNPWGLECQVCIWHPPGAGGDVRFYACDPSLPGAPSTLCVHDCEFCQ